MAAEAAPAVGPTLTVVVGGVVPKLGPDGRQLRAAGAIRVSEGKQAEGQHEPLVDRPTFEQVQRRLAEARTYQSAARRTVRSHVLAGLLRCDVCGGPMAPNVSAPGSGRQGQVLCAGRHKGRGCNGRAYRLDVAERALLDQVRRLRGSLRTSAQEEMLAGSDGAAAASLQEQLDEARLILKRASERVLLMVREPTAEERAVFDSIRAEQGARIAQLEASLAALQHDAQAIPRLRALQHDAQAIPRLRALHQRLMQTEIVHLIDSLQAQGDTVGLRDLVAGLVHSAVLVERYPERRTRRVRLRVTWQPDVERLLETGLLWLAPEPIRP